jgi:hypothetical protein
VVTDAQEDKLRRLRGLPWERKERKMGRVVLGLLGIGAVVLLLAWWGGWL